LARQSCDPYLKQPAFSIYDICYLRIIHSLEQVCWKRYSVRAVALRIGARAMRGEFIEGLCDDGQIGARLRLIEPDQDVSNLYQHSVCYMQMAHDTAGRMLDLLDVGFDHQ
jgi:hypothetical protein